MAQVIIFGKEDGRCPYCGVETISSVCPICGYNEDHNEEEAP